jgi:Glycosyl hydrolase family 57
MNFININPITIYASQPFVYCLNSLVNRIVQKDKQFFNLQKSEELTKTFIDTVLLPTLEFMDKNELKANLILTGKLIEHIGKNKKVKAKIIGMYQSGSLKLVADSYYGESLVSLFNSSLWVSSLKDTIETMKKVLNIQPSIIFIPQLFRTLELEKVTNELGITHFLTRKKGQKPDAFKLLLSELRRFDGGDASWIRGEIDIICDFYNVSDNLFYDLNLVLLGESIQAVTKALNMEMGLNYSQFLLKRKSRKLDKKPESIRIEEKHSLYLYNHIQRAVIRIWQHGSMVLASSVELDPELNSELATALAKLQTTTFLNFLEKKYYIGQKIDNFTSPYEAFVNMQSAVKEIEILVRNKV